MIDELKKSKCYHSKDRTSFIQAAQKKIKEIVDPEVHNLAFTLSTDKTLKQYSFTHYCRDHKQFLSEEHLKTCSHLNVNDHAVKDPISNKV
jgi:hypothetical protein